MKCLVTGGAGFIASHIIDELIAKKNKVAVIDNLSTGLEKNLNPKVNFYLADVSDPKISTIFEKEQPEVVFHYAAQINVRKSVQDPIFSAKTNILGTLNILQNCVKYGVKKIIFASSGGAIYGEADIVPTPENYPPKPISPYGVEKLIAEQYLNYYKEAHGLDYLALRFANVYGPRQNSKGEAGVVAIFCGKMQSKEQIVINGDGLQTRDFVFVDDVVRANILGLEGKKSGVFNIGTSKEIDINTVFSKLKKFFKYEIKESHGPQGLGEQRRSCLDFKKVKEGLNWQPEINLDEGLKKTKAWFAAKN